MMMTLKDVSRGEGNEGEFNRGYHTDLNLRSSSRTEPKWREENEGRRRRESE